MFETEQGDGRASICQLFFGGKQTLQETGGKTIDENNFSAPQCQNSNGISGLKKIKKHSASVFREYI